MPALVEDTCVIFLFDGNIRVGPEPKRKWISHRQHRRPQVISEEALRDLGYSLEIFRIVFCAHSRPPKEERRHEWLNIP